MSRTLPLALFLLLACGDDDAPIDGRTDAGRDAGTDSAMGTDAGDAGSGDAGAPDAPVDAGVDARVMDPGTEGDGTFMIGPEYMDAPELMVMDGVERGRTFPFTMDSADSAVFPGVTGPYTRNVWVYVPARYVDGDAAPFMVVQDGGGHRGRLTPILDSMIGAEELPALVVIFINPGPGDGRGSERGLEYDTVSEAYTTFIETEVLPIIPEVPDIAAAYPGLRFTDDPEGRASFGGSSGGAAAFTMGWFRPDLYRRILTYSGTFVNQAPDEDYPHSAWEYHEHLLADTPVKPLRVFLQVGESDLNLDGRFGDDMHDWVAANDAMAEALEARGYHYRYLYSRGAGHVDDHVLRATLPDALRWLWRGYPID